MDLNPIKTHPLFPLLGHTLLGHAHLDHALSHAQMTQNCLKLFFTPKIYFWQTELPYICMIRITKGSYYIKRPSVRRYFSIIWNLHNDIRFRKTNFVICDHFISKLNANNEHKNSNHNKMMSIAVTCTIYPIFCSNCHFLVKT